MKQLLCSTSYLAVLLFVGMSHASAQQKKEVDLQRDDLFGPDKLWTIHVTIGAKEYDAMQPKGGGKMFMPFPKKEGFPPKKEAPKKAEPKNADPAGSDIHKNKAFGIEFPYVKGDIEFEGMLVKDVGIRYKGNSTYQASASSLRRPFKIDFNHYDDAKKLIGLNGMNLGNGIHDPTRIREALAYDLFRAAKVPAPRTAFVKLYLTVPTKYDKTYVGLYTLIEPVDKTFLKKHFQSDKGMLLKPEKIQGLPYLGERWTSYQETYNPKREPSDSQKRRLIDFTKFVNQTDAAAFEKSIETYLDVDGFLRFAAANSLITNLDSFFGLGHNYFLYLNPKTNRFTFMPWDVDLAFGSMNFGGGDSTEWAIAQPYTGKNKLTERILAIKKYNEAYRSHLKTLVENDFHPKTMRAKITRLEATIKNAVALERGQKGGGFGMPFGKKQDLRDFTTKRAESVVAQLDGKSQGKVLAGLGFGGPGGKGGPGFGGGFGPGNLLVKPIIDIVDSNKNARISHAEFKFAAEKLFKEAGGTEKTPVDEEKLIDTINRLMPAPPAFGGFKMPPPPKGFGPGRNIAGAILKHTATEKEKKITQAQWMAGAEKLFQQWDKSQSGFLDENRLRDGLNQFIPPPQFGPAPNFGPPFGEPKKDVSAKEKGS